VRRSIAREKDRGRLGAGSGVPLAGAAIHRRAGVTEMLKRGAAMSALAVLSAAGLMQAQTTMTEGADPRSGRRRYTKGALEPPTPTWTSSAPTTRRPQMDSGTRTNRKCDLVTDEGGWPQGRLPGRLRRTGPQPPTMALTPEGYKRVLDAALAASNRFIG